MRRAKAIRWIRGLLGVERHGEVGGGWPYRLVREQPEADAWRAELVDENGQVVGEPLARAVPREEAESACEAHHARTVAPRCGSCNGGGFIGPTHETPCPDCDQDAASWGAP